MLTTLLPKNTHFDAVIFDFDSTLVSIETLDEMIIQNSQNPKLTRENIEKECGKISNLYKTQNDNILDFYNTLIYRLGLIKLNKNHEARMQDQIFHALRPEASGFIQTLKDKGIEVYIISAGFKSLILPCALKIGFSEKNIFVNEFTYDTNGNIIGFDIHNPLIKYMGKVEIVKKTFNSNKKIAFIGDGYTDWLVGEKLKNVTYYFYSAK